jgi:hypothetical protein
MTLNVQHLQRTAQTLEHALTAIEGLKTQDEVMFDLYRNAAIKSFELSLETAGKLLCKAIKAYGSRVTGGAHDGSDLDLVLRNPADPAVALSSLAPPGRGPG